ncbi:LPXTG cell wall anchor domain-containing protein [Staphylococcus croceilyticus]|uniref:LPXTG cell wall anchor domain-containing protein n=1 Tax=Staphylococcus croceilyticus TaxID=319942 RepID=A0ABY2KG92_9STAP|nr:LPXTG cell wall anchor domain-containing protein [Staphylococcus croceilyticus]PNZ66711.1 hypothetical protein CD128_09660 [Staphylococcus croceilyticus]TGA81069.1 LPXTG cell wall anchor domain-containing protein [Staphylococcus croceilyticus]
MIKRGFKYAFGTTLVTSSLVLLSHGHAFAATNDTDSQFNPDANGNPITVQNNNNVDSGFNHDVDANNNVDPGFNHDVGNNTSENSEENTTDAEFNHDSDGNPITSKNNNNVDPGFNHDADGNPITSKNDNNVDPGFNHDANGNPITSSNHFPENNSPKTTPQDPSKSNAEENDMGFNGYPEQQGLVKQSNQQQDPSKSNAEDNDMGFNGYAEKQGLVKESNHQTSMPQQKQQESTTNTKAQQTTSNTNNVSNSTTTIQPNQSTTLSKQTSHSQQVNGATAQSTLPKSGESDTNTPLYVGLLALILGVSSLSLKSVITKKQ